MTNEKTRIMLKLKGLAPNKELGHNFLVHEHTPRNESSIWPGFTSEDQVVEVGVGLGGSTRPLAAAVSKVIGLEADSGIIRLHQEQGGSTCQRAPDPRRCPQG